MNTDKNNKFYDNSIGIVVTKSYSLSETLKLQSGDFLKDVTLSYETYGNLNKDKTNAVLISHALSGTAHAAGYHTKDDKYPGWWDNYIGPGKPFDTEKYFIICSNVLGGCNGTTGPSSINSDTGKPYALDFPFITIGDMVSAQYQLVRHFGITKLLSVAGGSLGGMQALEWSISYPEMASSIIAIATSASLSAQGIALHEVGRQAIINDPKWNKGNYYDSDPPDAGLSLARMIGHITYLSEIHMHEKFGRRFQNSKISKNDLNNEFMVESYLHYQGMKFTDRFDANTYLYITRAIDFFDLKNIYEGSLINAFENVQSNFLIVSFTSDWLYPGSQSKEIIKALRANGKNVIYTNINSDKGHDSFLIDNDVLKRNISNFLMKEFEKENDNT